MKILKNSFLIFGLLLSSQAFALDLTSAKADGIIGEQANGYIGFVKSGSSEIKELVSEVNAKRKTRYKEIAISKKVSLNEVEKVGGKTTIGKTKSGNYVKLAGEGWSKK